MTLVATQQQARASASAGPSEGSGSSRVQEFIALNPPEFTRPDQREDPQDFINQLHRIFRIMHATEKEGYAPSLVATMWDKIHRSIAGLALELTEACATAALQDSMDISQIQGYKYDRHTQSGPGESFQASGLQRQQGLGQTWSILPWCAICGRGHFGQFRAGSDACYTCGCPGHMTRDCPNRDSRGMAQPANSTIGSAMSVHPSGRESQSLAGRGRGRGRGSSSGGNQNRIYALAGR
uniref:Uncharacterized protein LOC104222000 n=1 Tax=Nicotiana sylvestris TaxID=4096 RepID=A0A1U7VUC7_NICSY|nr:PREDICTED: uncharacterized protein LOC104222000 [Nicotiana sylvestris]